MEDIGLASNLRLKKMHGQLLCLRERENLTRTYLTAEVIGSELSITLVVLKILPLIAIKPFCLQGASIVTAFRLAATKNSDLRGVSLLFAVGGHDGSEPHGDGAEAQHHVRVLRHGHQGPALQHLEHDRARHHLRSRYGRGFLGFIHRQKAWWCKSTAYVPNYLCFFAFCRVVVPSRRFYGALVSLQEVGRWWSVGVILCPII